MINATNTPVDEWQFDDSKSNYLLSLLENTVYSEEKKDRYRDLIAAGVDENEYNALIWAFKCDRIDDVTMRGTYGQRELIKHLKRLK